MLINTNSVKTGQELSDRKFFCWEQSTDKRRQTSKDVSSQLWWQYVCANRT